jgi:hypothetical protein
VSGFQKERDLRSVVLTIGLWSDVYDLTSLTPRSLFLYSMPDIMKKMLSKETTVYYMEHNFILSSAHEAQQLRKVAFWYTESRIKLKSSINRIVQSNMC